MQALGLVWGHQDSVAANLKESRTQITEPTQHGAHLLLEAWRTKQAQDGFVVGRDVPSRALASVLRNIGLYEPIDDMTDFRIRLAGTVFMRRFGQDVTGMRFSEVFDRATFAARRNSLVDVVTSKLPYMVDVRLTRDDRAYQRFEALRLPVLSANRTETWVMGGVFYFDWS